jgi:hypothetical protein
MHTKFYLENTKARDELKNLGIVGIFILSHALVTLDKGLNG